MEILLSSFSFEAVIKLILGFVLAGIIGAERESVNKPAGFKTHSLIGVSAVLIMLCGEYISKTAGNIDSTRIPAQLLSGIGFIGAGTILRDGVNVKGLTTAASLLAVTCIGLSIGAGFYVGGIIVTIIVYVILVYSHKLFIKINHCNNIKIIIKLNNYEEGLCEMEKIFDKYKIIIAKIRNNQRDKNCEAENDIQMILKYNRNININKVLTEISLIEDIIELDSE